LKGILKNSSAQGSTRESKQKKKQKFSVEFLFVDKSLQNLVIDQATESRHVS